MYEGDKLCPWRAMTSCRLKIIEIHHGMDCVVHHNEKEGIARAGRVCMPAKH